MNTFKCRKCGELAYSADARKVKDPCQRCGGGMKMLADHPIDDEHDAVL